MKKIDSTKFIEWEKECDIVLLVRYSEYLETILADVELGASTEDMSVGEDITSVRKVKSYLEWAKDIFESREKQSSIKAQSMSTTITIKNDEGVKKVEAGGYFLIVSDQDDVKGTKIYSSERGENGSIPRLMGWVEWAREQLRGLAEWRFKGSKDPT